MHQNLLAAQRKAEDLFGEIETRRVVAPGRMESEVNRDIYELAAALFGVEKHWHKRIVRAGVNTLAPYAQDPADLRIGEDDIVFLDVGPVFEQWEADFGRTYVLGSDPDKNRLCDDVEVGFAEGKRFFQDNPEVTASELFHHVVRFGEARGWTFGGPMAGHLIGQFPHERISGDKVSLYIHPDNPLPIRSFDGNGSPRHWILEIHYVDKGRGFGGFFEELLTC